MRVHVVHANNRWLYLDEIEAMHRHRYALFAEERGWRALESPDRLDVDEFDNEHATYLIAIDDHGQVMGSGRFIPSWQPNMLKNLFAEYCDGPVPVGPGIWEWSRHATPLSGAPMRHILRTQHLLNIAVIEFGLLRGMTQVYGILEANLMPWTAKLGWKSKLLGPPRHYGEGYAVASISPIAIAHLQHLRVEAGIEESVLIEAPGFGGGRGTLARRSLETISRLNETELAAALSTPTYSAHWQATS